MLFPIRSPHPAPLGVQIMTVISMERERCPRSARKTCLPLPGALATGAPALRPAYGQHITRGKANRLARARTGTVASNRVGGAALAPAADPQPDQHNCARLASRIPSFGKKEGKSQRGFRKNRSPKTMT